VTRTSAADFLDSRITRGYIHGNQVEVAGARDYILKSALTIRGVSREVELKVNYLGHGESVVGREGRKMDRQVRRCGRVRRQDRSTARFGVSWNDVVDKGGVVVGNTIESRSTQRRYWMTGRGKRKV